MIRILFFLFFLSLTYITNAQVINDDCSNAIDYGLLDGMMNYGGAPDGALYDTCFQVSNIGAVPNFPFFYTNDWCGQVSTTTINGAHNDVWYKISGTTFFFRMSCFANSFPSNDTAQVTFWTGSGNGCGNFLGNTTFLIPFDSGYFGDTYWYIGGTDLYLQISAKNPTDTIQFTMCLVGVPFFGGIYCSVTGSAYDSLCFLTSIDKTNPSDFSTSDGSIHLGVEYGKPPYSFLWEGGDTASQLFNLSVGEYNVTVTDSSGCVNIFTIPLSSTTSIDEPFGSRMRTYPNPSSDYINIALKGSKQVYIYDSQGKICKKVRTEDNTINVSNLSSGLYFLNIFSEELRLSISKKIIIQH